MGVFLELISGLIVLLLGGESLVRGSVLIAKKLKISPFIIGLTIVSFGTSAPELLVSLQATIGGSPDLAVGNVIGSNIANFALVLGITALLMPIVIDRIKLRNYWLFMMLATIVFYFFSIDNIIQQWEGSILFLCLIVFVGVLIRNASKGQVFDNSNKAEETSHKKTYYLILYVLAGMVGLYFGSELLVESAVSIAKDYNVSEPVIGVTIVALGTSLPELTASCVAAFKKEAGLSVGNLIGSNIFNIMAVIGLTGIIRPISISPEMLSFDMIWLLGISLFMAPVLFVYSKIGRVKGVLLLISYFTYIFLVLGGVT